MSDNTKELLGDIFCYEENPSFLTNELAIKRGIKSYFISQKEETNEQVSVVSLQATNDIASIFYSTIFCVFQLPISG